jgi:hypothetical protein
VRADAECATDWPALLNAQGSRPAILEGTLVGIWTTACHHPVSTEAERKNNETIGRTQLCTTTSSLSMSTASWLQSTSSLQAPQTS